jgi:Fis family transcriptional regulator
MNNSNVIDISSAQNNNETSSLSANVRASLVQYLNELDGTDPGNLYEMVLQQVEQPLLEIVMQHVDGNQSKAAECLGINRGTLRKKLKTYNLIK